jgi:hypothetical protein
LRTRRTICRYSDRCLIWPAKFRKLRQQLNLLQDGGSNDWSQTGMLICKKRGEAIEIGKRCSRPLDL